MTLTAYGYRRPTFCHLANSAFTLPHYLDGNGSYSIELNLAGSQFHRNGFGIIFQGLNPLVKGRRENQLVRECPGVFLPREKLFSIFLEGGSH